MFTKLTRAFVLILVAALALVPAAVAQQTSPGAPVTQTGSTGLAASTCLVVNSGATATVQQTLTVPNPGGSNSIYFDYIALTANSTAAVTTSATPLVFTTTNIAGTPSFAVASGAGGGGNLAAAGGQSYAVGATGSLGIPIKSQAGTSPTIVSPTATTGLAPHLAACWHAAP